MTKSNDKTLGLVQLAVMSAIIILLAMIPGIGYIPLPFLGIRATIIHVPVIIGSIVLGPRKGAFLGFLFGLTSLITNTISPGITSFVFSPFYSVGEMKGNFLSLVICFVPRILVGVVPYFINKLICKITKSDKGYNIISLSIAGLAGALTNTLLVMNMIYIFFGEAYAAAKETAFEVVYGLILTVIATNGIPEAIVAAILTCAICQAIMRISKSKIKV